MGNSKDETIESLKSNIERFRSDANKDASKIDELEGDLDQRTREVILKDRKLRELKEKLKKQNEILRDREFDVEELKNRTRLNLDYAAEKQKEIQQLETAVNTLKNTTAIKESQIIQLGQELKDQVAQLNLQISANEELKAEVAEGLSGMEAREQQVATLEGAVQSLKQIIKQNTGRISGLQPEVDAGKTIDVKNGQLEALQRRVETFKQDKKNLLGIVQQLATIGNPAFNFKSFMDHFDEKEEEEDVNTFSASEEVRAFKTAPLFAQESQRSARTSIAKDRSRGRRNKKQQSRKRLQSIPRGKRPEEGNFSSQHQR